VSSRRWGKASRWLAGVAKEVGEGGIRARGIADAAWEVGGGSDPDMLAGLSKTCPWRWGKIKKMDIAKKKQI
jgi:hypothetical protein